MIVVGSKVLQININFNNCYINKTIDKSALKIISRILV